MRCAVFDKRLFSLTPGIGKLVAAKVVALWLSLLADVLFAFMMANLLVSVRSGRPRGWTWSCRRPTCCWRCWCC